jgi:hypothetical protein
MSTVTHTSMEKFWALPWKLYEKATKIAREISAKHG